MSIVIVTHSPFKGTRKYFLVRGAGSDGGALEVDFLVADAAASMRRVGLPSPSDPRVM